MILPLNLELSENINISNNEEGRDFNIFNPNDLFSDEVSLLSTLFRQKEESVNDLLKTNHRINGIKNFQNIENINRQELSEEKNKNNNKEIPPGYFSLNKIKELLTDKLPKEILEEFNKKIFNENKILKVESDIDDQVLLGKKRKKKNKEEFKDNGKKEIGRKRKEDNSNRKHNKYCGDNIIKKIKFKLLEFFLKFVNKVINKTLDQDKLFKYLKLIRPKRKSIKNFENILKMIHYQDYIESLNKNKDLSILHMPFKEIFSQKITGRFLMINPNSNEIIIKKLLEEEKDENIQFVLNMHFKDWIDVFTYKKVFISKILSNEKVDNLAQYMEYADKLILKMYKLYPNDDYLLYFMIYLYNYERWFSIKRGRVRTSNKNKKERI